MSDVSAVPRDLARRLADLDVVGDEPLVVTATDSAATDAYQQLTAQLERVFGGKARGSDLQTGPADRFA
jgi:hypothetical protein